MSDMETQQWLILVAFCPHGSPWKCCKESESSKRWAEVGFPHVVRKSKLLKLHTQLVQNALANHIKGVVFIGAHWEELDDSIQVTTKLNPDKVQMEMVDPKY